MHISGEEARNKMIWDSFTSIARASSALSSWGVARLISSRRGGVVCSKERARMRKGSVQDLLKECMVFLHLCPRRRWFYYQKAWHSNNAKENLETVIVQVQPSRTLQFSNKILPHLVIFVTYCLSLVVLHSFHTNQRVYYTCYSF